MSSPKQTLHYNIEGTYLQIQQSDISCLLLKKEFSLHIKKTSDETSIQDKNAPTHNINIESITIYTTCYDTQKKLVKISMS